MEEFGAFTVSHRWGSRFTVAAACFVALMGVKCVLAIWHFALTPLRCCLLVVAPAWGIHTCFHLDMALLPQSDSRAACGVWNCRFLESGCRDHHHFDQVLVLAFQVSSKIFCFFSISAGVLIQFFLSLCNRAETMP